MLRTFGETLETLSFGYERLAFERWLQMDNSESDVCDVVCTHCPNLSDFEKLSYGIPFALYVMLLKRYESQLRYAKQSLGSVSIWLQPLQACPNARFSFNIEFGSTRLDVLQAFEPRMHGRVEFKCHGLSDTDVDKFRLCMKKLDYTSDIQVVLGREQVEQSILLDVLAEFKPSKLKNLFITKNVLGGTSLGKLLLVMPMIRSLRINCDNISDEETLAQVYATGTNLECISLRVRNYNLADDTKMQLRAVFTLMRIVNAIHSHAKLKRMSIEYTRDVHISEVIDWARVVVHYLRNRHILT